MHELGNIVIVKSKFFEREEVLNIFDVTGNEVIHTYYFVTLLNKTVAEVGTQETCRAGNENAFSHIFSCQCSDISVQLSAINPSRLFL